jgi:hypothetical protein
MLTDDPVYLLDQADRFRRLAPRMYDDEARETILRLADECELRALTIHPSFTPAALASQVTLPENHRNRGHLKGIARPKSGQGQDGLV